MTLADLLHLLRRHVALLIAAAVVCGAAAGAYVLLNSSEAYSASVTVYAQNTADSLQSKKNDNVRTESQSALADMQAASLLVNDIAELAQNEAVVQETAQAMGLQNLDGYSVEAEAVKDTRMVTITVSGPDANTVAVAANTLANKVGTTAQNVMGVDKVSIINEAWVPQAPNSSKSLAKYLLVGVIAGLFLGICIVVVRDMFDTSIRSEEEVEELLQMPVIARLPYLGR